MPQVTQTNGYLVTILEERQKEHFIKKGTITKPNKYRICLPSDSEGSLSEITVLMPECYCDFREMTL
ncbi:unnamed protein product [Caretta caretta]